MTTNPNLKPTPVNVTTPTIIPTQIAAAPTAKVFFAPDAKQFQRSLTLSLLVGFIKPIVIHEEARASALKAFQSLKKN